MESHGVWWRVMGYDADSHGVWWSHGVRCRQSWGMMQTIMGYDADNHGVWCRQSWGMMESHGVRCRQSWGMMQTIMGYEVDNGGGFWHNQGVGICQSGRRKLAIREAKAEYDWVGSWQSGRLTLNMSRLAAGNQGGWSLTWGGWQLEITKAKYECAEHEWIGSWQSGRLNMSGLAAGNQEG